MQITILFKEICNFKNKLEKYSVLMCCETGSWGGSGVTAEKF